MNEARKDLLISDVTPAEPDTRPQQESQTRPQQESQTKAGPDSPAKSNRRPDFPMQKADAASHVESGEGTEVIIYQTPQELPESSNFHIVVYIFIQLGSELLAKLFVGIFIVIAYHSSPLSFAPLVLFLVIYHFWKIAFNLFFYIAYGARVPEFRSAYILDIMLSVGYIVMFWALWAFLKGSLAPASLPLFVIPAIVLTLVRLCAGEAMSTPYLPGSFFAFFEALQVLYIALKLANPAGHAEWTWVLLFFYVLAILTLILAFILMIVLIILLMMILFQSEPIRELPNLTIFVICGVIFYVVWNGIMYYYLLSGFHLLLDANQVGAKPAGGEPNARLLVIAWFTIVCAAVTLVLLLIIYCLLKDMLLNYFNKNKAKEISLQSFAKNLNMNITKVSGNYFKRNAGDEENPGVKLKESSGQAAQEMCMICCDKPSEVLFHPCGHSGVCEGCLRDYLKDKDDCPMCREKVEKVYLIFYDEKKKGFMARGVIKIKR